MNLFNWIREGVRQAVLLGVSEAVDTIGAAPNGEDMSKRLLEVLRRGSPEAPPTQFALPPKRRKLGRSLSDIQTAAEQPGS